MSLFWRCGHVNAFKHKMLRSPEQYISVSLATFILPSNGKISVCISDAQSRPVYGCMLYYHFLVWPMAKLLLLDKYSHHGMWLVVSAQRELSTWGRQELPCTWEPCKPEQPAKGTGAANAGELPRSCSFLTPAGTCTRVNTFKQLSAVSSFCARVHLTVIQGNNSCSDPQQFLSHTLVQALFLVPYSVT